jgi:ABC-2 type transport system permease protein
MLAIFQKELSSFFSSLIGYLAIGVFLILTGLIMWVFPNNAFDFGYANLDILFDNAPLVFMLLIPAVTMRMFSEEMRSGTLELLVTRPLTELQIILGKYFASLTLVIIAVMPTLLYYFTISTLALPAGNVDHGAIIGSYIGLLLLSAVFVSLGLLASSLSSNQMVAFVLAALLCFLLFVAFTALGSLGWFGGQIDHLILMLGIQHHYNSVSRGIVDSKDIIYFLSLIVLFIFCTKTVLESRKW